MELAVVGDTFHADDFASGHEAQRDQATIDGAITSRPSESQSMIAT
jgi:hypothetical protein